MSASAPGDRRSVHVLYTPASLADDLEAGEEVARITKDHRSGSDRKLSKDLVTELSAAGWLRQARWRRGGYFTTQGLEKACGVPEFALLNVPGVVAPWAHTLLNRISDYVLESRVRLEPGEIFSLPVPNFPEMMVTFNLVEPGDMHQPEFSQPVLLVVPLP